MNNQRLQELAQQAQLCYNYLGLGSDRSNEYNTRLERFSTMLIEQCITHITSLESKLSLDSKLIMCIIHCSISMVLNLSSLVLYSLDLSDPKFK